MNFNKYLRVNDEVRDALSEKKPVVALESTIISHGMPYPKNLETALKCEEILRENGVVPATTAIIDGKIRVGLTQDEIKYMATADDIIKCSKRDLGYVISHGLNGATTVSTSIIAANMAGIKILVTGGIGGVHRGAEASFDISRDLMQIASTNIIVVCAGAKSILDIGLTLEYLETQGVTVLGYKTDKMPAFYTRDSGYNLDYRIDSPKEAAEIAKAQWDMLLDGGVVLANPIPLEYSMDREKIDAAISRALEEAEKKNIKGKEITPFLLDYVLKETGGNSLDANIELVKNNVLLGAEVSKYL